MSQKQNKLAERGIDTDGCPQKISYNIM